MNSTATTYGQAFVKVLLAVLILVAIVSNAYSDIVIHPVDAIAGTMGQAGGHFIVDDTITLQHTDNLVLPFGSGDDFTAVTAITNLFSGAGSGTWYSASGSTTGTIIWDLGSEQSVGQMALWNAPLNSPGSLRSIQQFSIESDEFNWFPSPTAMGTFTATIGSASTAPQVFDLTDTTNRYLRMTVYSNYGDSNFTSMGHITFGTSNIPEPSLCGLSCLLTLLCLTRRRSPYQ